MITVETAIQKVTDHIFPLSVATMMVPETVGYILAETIFSPINMPPFPQSAMDGYAINYDPEIYMYSLIGEVAAGNSGKEFFLKPGEAVRVFTGAPVPKGSNTVVKQEIVTKTNNTISFNESIEKNQNIRPVGEQIRTGDVALHKGTRLSPAAVGLLCGLGITSVNVYRKPRISIIATGSELVKPGSPLPYGKIYESNSYMLNSALQQFGYRDISITTIKDTFEETKHAIVNALQNSDVLILSGGISVGDYDFVGKALREIGVEEIFYKVKQKPGKPLFFGKINDKSIFALPGNPAAAMTSFYIYVLLALDRLSGKEICGLEKRKFPLAMDYTKKGDRAQFLKAKVENEKVHILEGQSSAMLHSFAASGMLVYVPLEISTLKKDTNVITYVLP